LTVNPDVYPTLANQIANWDHEADVVIAGYGIAGAAAAVEAAAAGADVLVLERTGGWGGAAAMAGGFIYLGGGTGLQHACGFEDSVDNMMRRVHPRRPGDHARRRSATCQRCADTWVVRRRPHHIRSGRVGLCQRNLARRRQFLRSTRRAVGG
jgi:3-oxo-5alpha-steroid 4-dehydrogenase